LKILPISAHTQQSLDHRIRDFREFLLRSPAEELQDICYTASVRRSHRQHRAAVAGRTREELAEALANLPDSSQARSNFEPPLIEQYLSGNDVDWGAYYSQGRCISLPIYRFDRERFWPEWLTAQLICTPLEPATVSEKAPVARYENKDGLSERLQRAEPGSRYPLLLDHVCSSISELLGLDSYQAPKPEDKFLDIGLNSLLIMELRARLQNGLPVSLPATLFFEYPTIEAFTRNLLAKISGGAQAKTSFNGRRNGNAAHLIDELEQLSDEEAEARIIEKFAALEG